VPSDFHLFGPLNETPEGKIFRAEDEVKLFVQRWLNKQTQTVFKTGIMRLPERWKRCIEVQREYAEKKYYFKKCKTFKNSPVYI
jgi:hypothetical protein